MTTSNSHVHPTFAAILNSFAACPIGRQPAADARLLADIAAADAHVRPEPHDGVPADVAAVDRIIATERQRGAVEPKADAGDNLIDSAEMCRYRTTIVREALLDAQKALLDAGMLEAYRVIDAIVPARDSLTCRCGEVMQFAPREKPDPEINVPGHSPQWGCSGCGRTIDIDPTDQANLARV